MQYRKLITVAVSLFALQTARPQTPEDFSSAYSKIESRLYERYVFNKKVVWKHYDKDNSPLWTKTSITSTDSTHILCEFKNGNFESHLQLSDNMYTISNSKTKPAIAFHGGPKAFEFGFPYTGLYRLSAQIWPMTFYDLSTGNTIGDNIRQANLKLAELSPFQFQSIIESEFHGRNAFAVTGIGRSGPTSTAFYDRDKLIFLGFVNKKDGYEGYVTYDDKPGEDYPLPKQFEIWKVDAAGKKTLSSKDVIVEYSDYTPSPDEFDIEKRYGLKPLPPKVKLRPDAPLLLKSARAWGYWLYGGGILLALFSVGVLIYLRMKK